MEEHQLNQVESSGSTPTSPLQLTFDRIDYHMASTFLIKHHYLHRKAPVSFAFGAFFKGELVGALTIGKPASHTMIEGVCGKEQSARVFELNRLCMLDCCPKNSESRFVGWVLKQLPSNIILVSYADTAHSHVGYVYQATNWTYTGTSVPWIDYTKDGLDHRSIPKAERIKEHLTPVPRSSKHRYVYFCTKEDKVLLRWKVKPYPKVNHES